jgi:hypothetical protein
MKKIRSLVIYALLNAGMIYALIAMFPLPASACTPAQCNSIQQNVVAFCQAAGCATGSFVFCNASGYEFFCDGSGINCHEYMAQCP